MRRTPLFPSIAVPLVPALAAVWLAAACRSAVPEQKLSAPQPVAAPLAAPPSAGPWAFRVATERRAYAIDHRALLTIQQDTLLRVDSISSHLEVAFTSFGGGRRVTGSVGAFRVRASPKEPSTPPGLTLPIAFSASVPVSGRQLSFAPPETADSCASLEHEVRQSLRDLFFLPPDTLHEGSTWEDSASYVVCRDGLPLRATVFRTFRVTDAALRAGRWVLTVGRTSRSTLEGEGRRAGELVRVVGSGAGRLTYAVDPAGGEILSARGAATLDLTIRTRVRSQQVHQTSELQIVRGG